MTTLKDQWMAYSALAVPVNAGDVQVTQTRNAFYAGAIALSRAMVAAPDGKEKEACAALLAELDEYAARLIKEALSGNSG